MEDTIDPRWRESTRSSGNGGAFVEVGTAWRKASYSGNGGGSCVEVGTAWRKATYSGNGGGDCVEAGNVPGGVLVRDTTDRDGAVLSIPVEAWKIFTAALQ